MANSKIVFLSLGAFKTLLLRLLPDALALKVFNTLCLETIKDLTKSRFSYIQWTSLTFWFFSYIFETPYLKAEGWESIFSTRGIDLDCQDESDAVLIQNKLSFLPKSKRDVEIIDAYVKLLKEEFHGKMKEHRERYWDEDVEKFDLENWVKRFEPVIMYDIDKSVDFLSKLSEDALDRDWTIAVLKIFVRHKNSGRKRTEISNALKRTGTIERLIDRCHQFVEANIGKGLYDTLRSSITEVESAYEQQCFVNLILRAIMKFNTFDDSLSAATLIKLFDILVFFSFKQALYYDFREILECSASHKQAVVGQHIAEVCTSLVRSNNIRRHFLFEMFSEVMLDSTSDKLINESNPSNDVLADHIAVEDHLDRKHPFVNALLSISNEASTLAIEKLRLTYSKRALIKVPESIFCARESLHKLNAFWNLVVLGPDKGYFAINDQLSINAKLDLRGQNTSSLLRLRIVPTEDPYSDSTKSYIDRHLEYNSESASLKKADARLFRKFFSEIPPEGCFDRRKFAQFFNPIMDSSSFLQQMFAFDLSNRVKACEKVFARYDFDKTGMVPCKWFLKDIIVNAKNRLRIIDNFDSNVLLWKKTTDFELPNYQSRSLGVDVRPLSVQLDVPSLSSLCLNLESIAESTNSKPNNSTAVCSQKVVSLVKEPSKVHIILRRKNDSKNLLSLKLMQIK